MRAIVLPVLPDIELDPDPSFAIWERSFHARPCDATVYGIVCGHEAARRARATCTGCYRAVDDVFLCPEHMRAYDNGYLVFHAFPCGLFGFLAKLTNIEPV